VTTNASRSVPRRSLLSRVTRRQPSAFASATYSASQCLRPAEFLGHPPGRGGEARGALLADRRLAGQEALQRKLRESVRDFATEDHLMKRRGTSLQRSGGAIS
jgi:hypothetical protein